MASWAFHGAERRIVDERRFIRRSKYRWPRGEKKGKSHGEMKGREEEEERPGRATGRRKSGGERTCLGGIHPFPSNFEFPWEEKKKGREGGWARQAEENGQIVGKARNR